MTGAARRRLRFASPSNSFAFPAARWLRAASALRAAAVAAVVALAAFPVAGAENAPASLRERRLRTGEGLDGPARDVSVGAYRVLTPALAANVHLGWSDDRPEQESSRHAGYWVRAGANWDLRGGFSAFRSITAG